MNQYNQVPHLTKATTWESDQKHIRISSGSSLFAKVPVYLFVCFESFSPSHKFFSHVEMVLPGFSQH